MNYYLGFDVGATQTKFALTNTNFELIEHEIVLTSILGHKDNFIPGLTELINKSLSKNKINTDELMGIGIGLPGMVNKENNLAVRISSLGWRNYRGADMLQEHFGVPVFLENDANVNLLGEYFFGVSRGHNNVILLTLGTGIGGSIMIDNKIYSGSNGISGELGHMIVQHDGETCSCGAKGCLQSYCSSNAILNFTKKKMNTEKGSILWDLTNGEIENLTTEMIIYAFIMNDQLTFDVIKHAALYLSDALLSLINIFNPDLIVIAGGLSNLGEGFMNILRGKVARELRISEQICPIKKAQLGQMAGSFGACKLIALMLGLD